MGDHHGLDLLQAGMMMAVPLLAAYIRTVSHCSTLSVNVCVFSVKSAADVARADGAFACVLVCVLVCVGGGVLLDSGDATLVA